MKQIEVKLLITLDNTVVKAHAIWNRNTLDEVRQHLKSAIGNQTIINWGLIEECEVVDIKVKE